MASELSKLMKQYGVSSATMAVPPNFKESEPVAPTAPLAPVKPADFTDTAPDYLSYGLTKSQSGNSKAAPTKLDSKEQTGADLKTIQDNWTNYQKELAAFNANKAANKQAVDAYTAYYKPDPTFADKNTYDYKNNEYLLANQKYQSALGKYNTNKAAFDAGKGDVYNTYKTAYQDRIAQTPMYLQQQFTRASNANPYEGMYSPYGSIDNYNKTGTYWNDVIGDPTYTGAYTPYTPLYKQKGFKDQASYEATLPTWQQQGYGSELQYLDAKNSNDDLTQVPNINANTTPSLTDLAFKNGVTNSVTDNGYVPPSTIVDTKVPSTIVDNATLERNPDTPSQPAVTQQPLGIANEVSEWEYNSNKAREKTAAWDTQQKILADAQAKRDAELLAITNPSVAFDSGALTSDELNRLRDLNTIASKTNAQSLNPYGTMDATGLNPYNTVDTSSAGYTPSQPAVTYTYAPSSQQQLEDKAVNAGYQGDYTDTAAMNSFINANNQSVAPAVTNTTPTLTDLAVKNGVTNTGTQQISNTTPADKTTTSLVSQPNVMQQAKMTPWDSMGITQDDYYENYYAKGGSVHDMARKYEVGGGVDIAAGAMPNPEAGIPQPAPVAVQAPPSDNMAKMQEMLQAYGTPTNDYAQELEEARRKSNAENEAFMDMFKKARQPENDNLSQAELYFRLAAAAGAPTKTGGIAESLSNINREMADYSKEQTGRRNSDLELQMKAQQLKSANAKEDLNTLRGLAGESMKDKRAIISEMIKAEIPKAQSEAGKLALDMGLKVGTPEYQQFVTNNGMQLLQAKVNQMVMGPVTAQGQLGVSTGQLDVARDRYNLSEKEYQDKMSGVIPPVELRKMEKDASKDLQTVENAAKQVNLIKNDVNALKTHPGLSGITGMSGNIYKYPGSERAQAQTALESLQNKLEGFGKVAQSASGAIGAMAVAEWKKMRDQIATIDPVKLGEQGTIKALGNLNDDLDASVSMLKSQYEREHSTILELNPNKFQLKLNFGQKVNDEASAKQAGWVLHQDANGNKAYINPANKSEHLEIQ